MKTYKQVLNEWAKNTDVLHEMTEYERDQMRNTLLEMYNDVYRLARENGLNILLAGGSALGAIRHQGFIPWDDDLDLVMHRKDYNKFLKLLDEGKLGDKYEYRYADGKMDATALFLQIFKKGTIYTAYDVEYNTFPKGIYLDVFTLDHVPSNAVLRRVKGLLANALRLISNCVFDYKFTSSRFKDEYIKYPDLYAYVKKRFIVGRFFSIIPHKKWIYWFNKFVADDRMGGLLCIPTGRKLYNGEVFKSEDYLPGTFATFEGLKVLVPTNYDAYLKNLYNNYMELPPEEKRERHFIGEFKI